MDEKKELNLEEMFEEEKTLSVKELRQIMKSTGLSFGQIVSHAKKIKKDMKQAEAEAEEKGVPFSRKEYLRNCMPKK